MARTALGGALRRAPRLALVTVILLVAVLAVALLALRPDAAEISFDGPDEEALINAAALEDLAFVVTADRPDALDEATIEHNGRDVTADAEVDGEALRYEPGDLDDGDHEVEIAVPGRVTNTGERWSFSVDATPPELELTEPDTEGVVFLNRDTVVAGTVEGAAELTLQGESVEVAEDGSFEVVFDEPPADVLRLEATDAAGNTTEEEIELTILRSRVEVDQIRGVHVTGHAWLHQGLREQVLEMIEDGKINTVQLDIKDESGHVHNRTDVTMANEIGAALDLYDLEDVVDTLHEMGVHVVGRVVAFRDPMIGEHAQASGNLDWLIQTPDGEPYTGRYPCCFSSFAHDEVIEYNISLAEEAAEAGVDGILWDYIRRPDGDPDNLVVPGLSDDADGATLEEAVVDFTAAADERLKPWHVEHGVSVYGIAATRPTEIAQDIPGMAPHVDYISPMLYPSHWAPGEYDVDDPIRQPYDIIHRTLPEFLEIAEESGRARIVPWLEDSNFRAWDRHEQVRQQISAAADRGVDEWLMWDSHVNYTVHAYDPVDD